jgi:DNA helicase II / ATP-dependent DNA helicase PcrA
VSQLVFTPQQQHAITFPRATQLIVAGAGSGKTTVMAERIAHLAEDIAPQQILGLTFSNKAAAHLRLAVADRLGPDSDVVVSTYHGFGSSLVSQHARALGFANANHGLAQGPRLIDFAQSLQLLLDIFDSAEFVQRKTGRPLFILREVLQLSSRMSDHLVDPAIVAADCAQIAANDDALDELRKAARSRGELVPLIEQYRHQKLALGLIDHDDQIRLAVEAVTTIDGVASELRQSYQAVLLDEYQDTNFAQRRLLQLVFGDGSARTITAVGDDMQSIYAFRGAHLTNLHHFHEHFANSKPTEPHALSQSFRNDRHILELANRIQTNVAGAQPKVLTPRQDAADGRLELFLGSDSWDEARTIATHVEQLRQGGSELNEIAILCRKRRLIPPLVDALDERGIAVEVMGLGGLLARPEIVELCCWLETIARSDERTTAVCVVRLLQGGRYRIGVRDMAVLGRAGGIEPGLASLDSLTELSTEAHSRLSRFVTERADLRRAATQLGLVELLEHVLALTGLWGAVEGDRPMENLARFLHVAERFRPLQGRRSLDEFLSWLRVMDEAEEDLSEAVGSTDLAVQIMTIHQAKGLEFDHVVIPGLSGSKASRIFPDTSRAEFPPTYGSSLPWWLREDNEGVTEPPTTTKALKVLRERNTDRQQAEEWRLLYVATTRARHSVLFTAAHWYFDTQTPQGPSSFYEWLARQDDVVVSLGSSRPAAASPGIGDRERRAEAAKSARDESSAPLPPSLPTMARRRSTSRGARRVDPDQLGLSFGTAMPAPIALRVPQSLPVSALVSLTRCARQFHWTHIRPMPRRSSPAAVLGTQIHSWIEQLGRGQHSFFSSSSINEIFPSSLTALPTDDQTTNDQRASEVDETVTNRLKRSFMTSHYGERLPVRVEQPIALSVESLLVRGRVDAAYHDDDEVLHVVDFKTGRPLDDDDPGREVQLDLYGLAALRLWRANEQQLRTTAAYLRQDGSGVTDYTTEWTPERTKRASQILDQSVHRIRSGDRQPHVGSWCSRCPYLDMCPEGRRSASS